MSRCLKSTLLAGSFLVWWCRVYLHCFEIEENTLFFGNEHKSKYFLYCTALDNFFVVLHNCFSWLSALIVLWYWHVSSKIAADSQLFELCSEKVSSLLYERRLFNGGEPFLCQLLLSRAAEGRGNSGRGLGGGWWQFVCLGFVCFLTLLSRLICIRTLDYFRGKKSALSSAYTLEFNRQKPVYKI